MDFGFYNMDCMQGMKQFPDDYFDLAIVDPPYGAGLADNGGCKGWFSKYHQETAENQGGVRKSIGTGSADGSTSTNTLSTKELQKTRRHLGICKLENGRRQRQKNHNVGRGPEKGILRRTFSRLTKPNYMGGATTLSFHLQGAL